MILNLVGNGKIKNENISEMTCRRSKGSDSYRSGVQVEHMNIDLGIHLVWPYNFCHL